MTLGDLARERRVAGREQIRRYPERATCDTVKCHASRDHALGIAGLTDIRKIGGSTHMILSAINDTKYRETSPGDLFRHKQLHSSVHCPSTRSTRGSSRGSGTDLGSSLTGGQLRSRPVLPRFNALLRLSVNLRSFLACGSTKSGLGTASNWAALQLCLLVWFSSLVDWAGCRLRTISGAFRISARGYEHVK